jgi:succinyl-diaminopimelate desuccinylase
MLQDKHIQLLQRLIACRSITPTNDGALEVVQDYLYNLGFKGQIKIFGNGAGEVANLYSVMESNINGKNLCFAGHTDVVPPGEVAKWSSDPFKATIKNGVLYGRGAVDMKSAIIAFIAAVEHYLLVEKPLGSISLLITADEEGPATFGINSMIQWLYDNQIRIDHCIVGEPVSKEKVGDNIKIGARGSANFIIKIYGIQGHVAYNHLTDNPVRKANKILSDLLEYNFKHKNLIFDKSNVEITKISCDSGAENIVPESLLMRLNYRYGDDYNYEKLHVMVENIVKKHVVNESDYEIDSKTSGDAALWVKNINSSELLSITKESIEKTTGKAPEVTTYGGTSDARFIRRYCEVVEVGLVGSTAHHIDENTSLQDLEILAQIYFAMISNYFTKLS